MMRHISEALADYLQGLEVPVSGGTAVSLSAERIRRACRQDDLWRAGAPGEQLVLDFGGTAVMV